MMFIDHERLSRYVTTRLLPALGCTGCPFTLTETTLGIHSRVFFLDIQGYKPLILKALSSRRRFTMLCACAKHLAQHGISAPCVVHADPDAWLLGRRGFHVVCEERVIGRTLFESGVPNEILPTVAAFFARMHNVYSNHWGTLDRLRTRGLYRHLMKRLEQKISYWHGADKTISRSFVVCIKQWARKWQQCIDAVTRYSLSHGDPNPGNIIMTERCKPVLLDIGHIRYLPRAIDYWMVKLHLCRDNTERAALFDSAYVDAMDPAHYAAFRDTEPFYALYVFVDFAALLATRIKTTGADDRYYDEYRSGLSTVRHMIENLLSGH
ncbi:MAG: aminoglycoside phosphotransferase family protein [Desulfobacterota bacterium]|nr:aminoglycoside phosphotransferase family protein [Thermodesulfobacteriota bacterium]